MVAAVLPWDVIGRAVASCTTLETVEIRLEVIGRLPPTPFRSIPNITALLNELVRLPVLRQLTLRIMNNPAAGGPGDRGGYCEEIMADLTCLDGICTEVVKQVKSMRHVRIFVEGYLFREGRNTLYDAGLGNQEARARRTANAESYRCGGGSRCGYG